MPAGETLLLHPDRPLRLDAARHAELHVESGTVWITASGAAGDLFLAVGESYRVPREAMVLVEAVRGAAGVRLVARKRRLVVAVEAWWRELLPGAIAQPPIAVLPAPTPGPTNASSWPVLVASRRAAISCREARWRRT
ncbi:MAG: DUF2917 domain-containing protein [Sulfuritalea sp.]|nr:DUF2917 domain-containing protein [Sulfuritalea sp.]